MEALDEFLIIVGVISLIIGVIRFIWLIFSWKVEWIDNLAIKVIEWNPNVDYEEYFSENGDCIYPQVVKGDLESGEEITVNFFIPNNAIIRNLKISEIIPKSIADGKDRYKPIKRISQITPDFPLCFIAERREAIAKYKVEWRTFYGAKASYYLYSNLRDGTYNKYGIQYSYGFISRIRKFLGLI